MVFYRVLNYLLFLALMLLGLWVFLSLFVSQYQCLQKFLNACMKCSAPTDEINSVHKVSWYLYCRNESVRKSVKQRKITAVTVDELKKTIWKLLGLRNCQRKWLWPLPRAQEETAWACNTNVSFTFYRTCSSLYWCYLRETVLKRKSSSYLKKVFISRVFL